MYINKYAVEDIIYKYFGEIINKYSFVLIIKNEYKFLLVKKDLTIEIYWGRFYEDFQMSFQSTKYRKLLSVLELLMHKDLIDQELLTQEESDYYDSLPNTFEKELYFNAFILENFCQEFLNGDLSLINQIGYKI